VLQNDAAGKKTFFSTLMIPDRVVFHTIEQEYRASALPMDCHRRHLSSIFSPLFSGNFTFSGRVIVALKAFPLIPTDHNPQTLSGGNVLRLCSHTAHNGA
jgi:hypothetical protein